MLLRAPCQWPDNFINFELGGVDVDRILVSRWIGTGERRFFPCSRGLGHELETCLEWKTEV